MYINRKPAFQKDKSMDVDYISKQKINKITRKNQKDRYGE